MGNLVLLLNLVLNNINIFCIILKFGMMLKMKCVLELRFEFRVNFKSKFMLWIFVRCEV